MKCLVLAESTQGAPTALACELLGLGRSLVDEAGGTVEAVLLGGGSAAQALIAHGAERVRVAEHELLGEYHAEAWTAALAAICREITCDLILIGHHAIGAELAPRLAFRLGTTAATGCVAVTCDAGKFSFTRPCYGGNAREVVTFKTRPAVVTIRRGSHPSLAADASRSGVVERVTVHLDAAALRTKVIARTRDAVDSTRLEDANAIVAGGRGINGAAGFRVLAELAHALGGAVGASRVPCDLGWCPRSWQIGLTGRTVTPELYIAVGISGAGHHMAGCGGAKAIVAVNTDANAAIFREARYGVVGDYQQFIPAFAAEVRKLRA